MNNTSNRKTNLFLSIVSLFIFSCNISYGQTTEEEKNQLYTLQSNVLNEERGYWISLPASYSQPYSDYKKYPICIVLDGGAHFSTAANTFQFMGGRQMPEMIVVGIKNVSRTRDYTPDKLQTVRKNDFGGGDNFLQFLEEELIPKLDKDFRTMPFRLLAGHSLGGLLSVHTYMKEQSIFNAFIAIDPSFGGWDNEKMDNKIAAMSPNASSRFIYLASANSFDGQEKNEKRHIRFIEGINEKFNDEIKAEMEYFDDENHQSVPLIAWIHGMKSIFKGYQYSYKNISSIEALQENYQSISERLSYEILPPESLVNRMGYRALRNKDGKELALEFFKLNTTNYPNSYNAFDSLADAYARLGDKEKAIENYKKSLALNPENTNAEGKIMQLSE